MTFEHQSAVADHVASGRKPEITTRPWQWGSIAVVARVPSAHTTKPDAVLWKTVANDITSTALLCKQKTAFAEYLKRQDNLAQVSSRWFKPSGMLNQFLVTSNEADSQSEKTNDGDKEGTDERSSGVPSEAFRKLPVVERLAAGGLTVAGVSRTRLESEGAEDAEYVVLHLNLSGRMLENPSGVIGKLHRYKSAENTDHPELSSEISGEDIKELVDLALKNSGVSAYLDWGGALTSFDNRKTRFDSIYTISTLVPYDDVPEFKDSGVADTHMTDSAHRWAFAMSTGRSATPTPPLSDLSAQGVSTSTVSLGPMVGWASERGLGLVAAGAPRTSADVWNSEVAHSIALAHSVFVDLSVLVMQQDRFLKRRTQALSGLASKIRKVEAADEKDQLAIVSSLLRRYKEIQQKHIDFLGRTWLQEIPGRPSASRVLRALQSVRMLEERIKHSVIEQRAVMDYLEADHAQRVEKDRLEEKIREAERQAAREQDRREQRAREAERQAAREKEAEAKAAISHRINIVAFVFLPASLIFTVTGGLGIPLHWGWAVGCGAVALAATLWLIWDLKPKE